MYMILCVIDKPELLQQVLHNWRQIGITGVTILESTGLHRVNALPRVSMRYSFGNPNSERGNYTLFTIVDDEEMIQRCLEATEAITGDFNEPNTGIFISWLLDFSKGVTGKQPF